MMKEINVMRIINIWEMIQGRKNDFLCFTKPIIINIENPRWMTYFTMIRTKTVSWCLSIQSKNLQATRRAWKNKFNIVEWLWICPQKPPNIFVTPCLHYFVNLCVIRSLFFTALFFFIRMKFIRRIGWKFLKFKKSKNVSMLTNHTFKKIRSFSAW